MNIRDIPFPTTGGQYTSDGTSLTRIDAPVAEPSTDAPVAEEAPASEPGAPASRARRSFSPTREESANG